MLLSHPKKLQNFYSDSQPQLIKGGSEYFVLLKKLIDEAKKLIHLHAYILQDDIAGRQVINSLKEAASRGVQVYLILDSFGSTNLKNKIISEIKQAGINFRFFTPLISRKGFHLGRRLHQKVLVVDSQKALIGGINIAERYLGSPQDPAWLDFAVLLQGSIAKEINKSCLKIWQKNFFKRNRPAKHSKRDVLKPQDFTSHSSFVRIRKNDWAIRKLEIAKSYRYIFKNAENYITIIGAYFLPSQPMRHLIKKARERGVKVKVILAKKSDEKFFKLAVNFLYRWLLRHNIEVYEYEPTVVHAKVAIADDLWATIGSHDLNFLSTYGLVEMNVEIFDRQFVLNFKNEINKIISQDCSLVSSNYLRQKSKPKKLIEWLAYHLVSLALWFLTFFNIQEIKNSRKKNNPLSLTNNQ